MSTLMTRTRSFLLASVAVALGTTGCSLVSAEANIPDACITRSGLTMQGLPVALPTATVNQSFTHDAFGDLKDLLGSNDQHLKAQVRFITATFHMESGATDLSFLQAASLQVSSMDSSAGLAPIDVIDCHSGMCPFQSPTVEIQATGNADLVEYVRAGALRFDLGLTGTLPTNDWAVGLEVCVSGKATFTE
jgi:hypothetical protein